MRRLSVDEFHEPFTFTKHRRSGLGVCLQPNPVVSPPAVDVPASDLNFSLQEHYPKLGGLVSGRAGFLAGWFESNRNVLQTRPEDLRDRGSPFASVD